MIKKLLATLFILFSLHGLLVAQEKNTLLHDKARNRDILVNQIDREGLSAFLKGDSFQALYNAYQPDKAAVEQLQSLMDNLSISIILATWCGDSKLQLPRFFKLLDEINYPADELFMIGVDFEKKATAIDVTNYHIKRVPTFIFYKDDKEIGRIVESPTESLESDMLKILTP